MPTKLGPHYSLKIRLFWGLLATAVLLTLLRFGNIRAFGFDFTQRDERQSEIATDEESRKEALRFSMYKVLFDLGIRTEWLSGTEERKTVRIPSDLPVEIPYAELASTFRELGGSLVSGRTSPNGDKKEMVVGYNDVPLFELTLLKDTNLARMSGKIAIVIDDFGYSFKARIQEFLDLPQPITISVLPGLEYSELVARTAREAGRDVLIHMPMQPEGNEFPRDSYMLMAGMKDQEIRTRLQKALKTVPNARGMNNHMGSLATSDEKLMKVVVAELKKTKLFFLDSKTSANSVACAVAKKAGLACASNDLFLDAFKEAPFIRSQINRLAELAARHGAAVGIGHPEQITLDALRAELPLLEKKGFQFVGVTELVNEEK